jgi:lipopolysaccharide export system protein LptC
LSRAALLLLLLAVVAAGTTWLAWLRPPEALRSPQHSDGPVADYYLKDISLRHYAVDGALHRLLKAERLEHIPGKGTQLEQPRLTQENPSGSPWQISAARGQLSPDGATLTLLGEVEISRLATPDNQPIHLLTSNLRYRQADGYAETDEAVTVTRDQSRIDAVGLKAWLQPPGHIQFLSQVKARYEP